MNKEVKLTGESDSDASRNDASRKNWEPMKVTYAGDARDIVQGGTGKTQITQADMGDTNKPKGQG